MRARRPPTPRARFAAAFARYTAAREARAALRKEVDAEWIERLRAYGVKGKDPGDVLDRAFKRLEPWEDAALVRPLADRIRRRLQELREIESWASTTMNRLASEAEIRTDDFRRVSETWISSYRSTNNGERYAWGLAEIQAASYRQHGIDVRVRKDDFRFLVEADIESEVDAEILRRRPSLSFRDYLKACWSKGLNPRVYNPFIPHGLEQRLGIDYQGRDVPTPSPDPHG